VNMSTMGSRKITRNRAVGLPADSVLGPVVDLGAVVARRSTSSVSPGLAGDCEAMARPGIWCIAWRCTWSGCRGHLACQSGGRGFLVSPSVVKDERAAAVDLVTDVGDIRGGDDVG
jgi:hypothetical protein